ncbi:histidine phosphatase superfamily [Cadophora sp. MPI-SDFR-AT-0126]|nr:histidine phosphatase superfamily [Leotiomycetes sp. MPI-SDFR-AT-0126]
MLSTIITAAGLASVVVGETIHGVTIFSRHGDRTSKHYSGYQLTPLGFTENFEVGSDYRDLYIADGASKQILGISASKYVPSQVFASAPDQQVLLNTATAFLQGLYPPLEAINATLAVQSLNNGTSYINPLNGYQYVVLHGEESTAPDTIWIKGDEGCTATTKFQGTFEESAEFASRTESTRVFYQQFWDVLKNVYDYTPDMLSYDKAYDIFDLINVATIHNASLASNITDEQLFQLRTLADSAEFGYNYNRTQTGRSIGGQTLLGGIFAQLNQTVSSKGKLKFSLLAGSYDNFMASFGLMNLTSANADFYGLPSYASTMSFELFTEEDTTSFPTNLDDLNVRFLFRNGSDAGATPTVYPLFGGTATSLPWGEFSAQIKARAITSVGQWCSACNATQSFCPSNSGSSSTTPSVSEPENDDGGSGGISNAVAGVIGAVVTLAVVALAGLAFWLVRRKRAPSSTVEHAVPMEKKTSLSS